MELLVEKECGKDLDFYCFYETSAKTGFNSKEIFIKAVKLLYISYKKYNSGKSPTDGTKKSQNKKLGKELLDKERKKKKECC